MSLGSSSPLLHARILSSRAITPSKTQPVASARLEASIPARIWIVSSVRKSVAFSIAGIRFVLKLSPIFGMIPSIPYSAELRLPTTVSHSCPSLAACPITPEAVYISSTTLRRRFCFCASVSSDHFFPYTSSAFDARVDSEIWRPIESPASTFPRRNDLSLTSASSTLMLYAAAPSAARRTYLSIMDIASAASTPALLNCMKDDVPTPLSLPARMFVSLLIVSRAPLAADSNSPNV